MSRTARFLRFAARGYQLSFAAVLGGQCRFHPSCSDYALEALARFGAVRGSALAFWRILRCHPFNPGGFDPPPPAPGPRPRAEV